MILKKIFLFLFLLNFIGAFYLFPREAFAASSCQSIGISPEITPNPLTEGVTSFTMALVGTVDPGDYRLRIGFGAVGALQTAYFGPVTATNGRVTFTINNSNVLSAGEHTATLVGGRTGDNDFCGDIKYKIGYDFSDCKMGFRPANLTTQQDFVIEVTNTPKGTYTLAFLDKGGNIKDQNGQSNQLMDITIGNGNKGTSSTLKFTVPLDGHFELRSKDIVSTNRTFCNTNATIRPIGNNPPVPVPPPGGGGGGSPGSPAAGQKCNITDGVPNPNGQGILTAIGCVPTEPQALINALIKVAAGVSGAIALLLMIAGSIQMLISGGTSEEIKKGRDQFIAAGVGLLFIILSVTLLQILGVDILNIPGFGK